MTAIFIHYSEIWQFVLKSPIPEPSQTNSGDRFARRLHRFTPSYLIESGKGHEAEIEINVQRLPDRTLRILRCGERVSAADPRASVSQSLHLVELRRGKRKASVSFLETHCFSLFRIIVTSL
jgi:hypothetical protein